MTKTEALRAAAEETFLSFFRAPFCIAFTAALTTTAVLFGWLLLRALLVLTFPISIPLMAWAIYADERKHEKQAKEVIDRMRGDIHRNGRTTP